MTHQAAHILASYELAQDHPSASTGRTHFNGDGASETSISPIDGSTLLEFRGTSAKQREQVVAKAAEAFTQWRTVPAARRAQLVTIMARHIKDHADSLAEMMTVEMGKPLPEAKGEVANVVATAHYAASLYHTIGGQEFPSQRPDVQLMEKWHPLGPVLVISAFNFPYALWAWNAFTALVCGNSVVWKPAPQTPLCTMAMHKVLAGALAEFGDAPEGLLSYIIGSNEDVAIPLVNDTRFPLVSATGSIPMGHAVGKAVGARLGRVILELGGNTAGILTPSADEEQALRLAFFSATLNGGQRCTALRRLLVHESRYDDIVKRLKNAYNSWPVGDVFADGHRLPPMVDQKAADHYTAKIDALAKEDGVRLFRPDMRLPQKGCYVHPYLAELDVDAPQPQDETFGPLLYVQPYSTLDEAMAKHNAVEQGLSSGIFSRDMGEIQHFISSTGSDAGVAMVNDNTGGPEVVLAFGGNKQSGLGSEKGGNSWQQYMRRQSIMLNYSTGIPADAGIQF